MRALQEDRINIQQMQKITRQLTRKQFHERATAKQIQIKIKQYKQQMQKQEQQQLSQDTQQNIRNSVPHNNDISHFNNIQQINLSQYEHS